ncbi:MAG: DUF86 domain-containing protein [Nitrospinae bacterium]|nr:DUF86 domain-containing protein [Nitrospinota bacterium]
MKKEAKFRLTKHIEFLKDELKDYENFKSLSWEEYKTNRNRRRDAERWIENIVNSSIDIAKIILTSEELPLADTYKDMIVSLSLVSIFNKEDMERLSKWVRLRNIISHEYLDIRWSSIKKFISETEPSYEDFLNRVRKYLEAKIESI